MFVGEKDSRAALQPWRGAAEKPTDSIKDSNMASIMDHETLGSTLPFHATSATPPTPQPPLHPRHTEVQDRVLREGDRR